MKNSSDMIEKRMNKFRKKSKSTNVLEIDPNDQHYKRYFNSLYGDELQQQIRSNRRSKPAKKSSLSFQQVRSASFKEDEINRKMNWKKLQLSRIKLKQTAKTSALFAGFAMVNLVEVQFNNDPQNPVPGILLMLFGVCSILLVSVHILALMIATCIMPSVESIALLENAETASEADAPHERLRFFIELAWTFSSVIGVFLFLAEVIILLWVKFWEMGQPLGEPGRRAALASSIVYIPFVLVFFFFAIYFYRDFAKNKLNKSSKQIKELESIIVSLEQNDLTFCQSLPCEDKPNDVNNNRKRSHPVISRQQQFHTRQQSELHPQAPPPPSNLFLKNLCKKNTSGSNDHLLAKDGLRSQSVSVDRINAFRMNDPRDEQGLRLDDLYRSKVCRTIGGGGGSQDNVRFSLDNVSLQTYASSFSAYNSIQNTIQHSLASGLQDGGIPDSFQDCSSGSAFNDSPLSRISRKSTSRPNSKMLPPSCPASAPQSSKSINLDGRSSTASINDQQSNDSKMPKKEGEPFNNLSATVV